MEYKDRPLFVIKKNLQKSSKTGVYFQQLMLPEVLADVCEKITGLSDFDYEFVDNDYEDEFLEPTYNKGRLAVMQYRDEVNYISFSEDKISGRNSSVQSVPTAFNTYYTSHHPKKYLYYYFLESAGNAETDYQRFIYRLMKTVGFNFLNDDEVLSSSIERFTSIDDLILSRDSNAKRNRSNNSTFITKDALGSIEVYGKTYGANKYETSLICYALAILRRQGQTISLYEVAEQDLKVLPTSSREVLELMGNININPAPMELERELYEKEDSLRSPRYTYNLLDKLGNKHCFLCACEIPELIQGAHIWPVADIKNDLTLNSQEKLAAAIDGENGLWLCENHHKMLDSNLLKFNTRGEVIFMRNIKKQDQNFMEENTPLRRLPDFVLTDKFCEYLWRREKAS